MAQQQLPFELKVIIPADDQKEAFDAAAAINHLMQKLGSKGILKLRDIYDKDFTIRTLVNKKLGIK